MKVVEKEALQSLDSGGGGLAWLVVKWPWAARMKWKSVRQTDGLKGRVIHWLREHGLTDH